jgi:hypothetical protein
MHRIFAFEVEAEETADSSLRRRMELSLKAPAFGPPHKAVPTRAGTGKTKQKSDASKKRQTQDPPSDQKNEGGAPAFFTG